MLNTELFWPHTVRLFSQVELKSISMASKLLQCISLARSSSKLYLF